MTDKEIGRKIKDKHPQYEGLSDAELGRRYRRKYLSETPYQPLDYKDKPNPSLPTLFVGTQTTQKRKQLEYAQTAYALESTVVEAEFHRKHRDEAHERHLEAERLNHEQSVLLRKTTIQASQHLLEAAPLKHEISLKEAIEASRLGVSVQQYQELKLAQAMIPVKVEESVKLKQVEADHAWELKELDEWMERMKAERTVQAAMIIRTAGYQQLLHIRTEVNRLIEDAERLRQIGTPAAHRQLEVTEELIDGFRTEIQNGFKALSGSSGSRVGGSTEEPPEPRKLS